MYEFSKTGQLLPILVGTEMDDPAGSGQRVPILGAERSRETGKVVPLGGTMEDPEGAGTRKSFNPLLNNSMILLTLSQTTNFRLFQTHRVSRLQCYI